MNIIKINRILLSELFAYSNETVTAMEVDRKIRVAGCRRIYHRQMKLSVHIPKFGGIS